LVLARRAQHPQFKSLELLVYLCREDRVTVMEEETMRMSRNPRTWIGATSSPVSFLAWLQGASIAQPRLQLKESVVVLNSEKRQGSALAGATNPGSVDPSESDQIRIDTEIRHPYGVIVVAV
jgi:hypothetical protein